MAISFHSSLQFCMHSNFTDKEGRFLLVNGSVSGVTLLNIYAPHENNSKFVKNVCELIIEKVNGIILIGGDFNCVLLDRMDKDSPSFATLYGASQALKHMIEDLGLMDAWRHFTQGNVITHNNTSETSPQVRHHH